MSKTAIAIQTGVFCLKIITIHLVASEILALAPRMRHHENVLAVNVLSIKVLSY